MFFWEKLIHNALLGTSKQAIDLSDAPEQLQQAANLLANESEQESKLLKLMALSLNFDRAGKNLPFSEKEQQAVEVCKEEQFPYCSERALSVLGDLLTEKRISLIYFWLYQCANKQQLVYPNLLPALLHFGQSQPIQSGTFQSPIEHRALIMHIIGNRGQWLAHQNPAWHYLIPVSIEEDWEHGNMEERKHALRSMRKIAPQKALDLLNTVWLEESATQRLEYLMILEEGLSLADEDFLKSKLHDRSGKVKTETLRLLRCIPHSEASQQVWDMISIYFSIKQRKKIMGNKPLEIVFHTEKQDSKIHTTGEENEEEEEVQHTEQEKAQKEKIFQETLDLVKIVPPTRWEQHFTLSASEIAAAFANTPKIRKFLVAITEAVLYYKDVTWAKALLDHESGQDARLLAVLPYTEREKYALQLVKNETDEVVECMLNEHYQEWSLAFSQKLMEVAITDVYSFNKEFFKKIIPFLHFDINHEILNYSFPDDYRKGYWKGTATEVSYLLGLREEVKQVFA